MTTFILTIAISALAGAACGYLFARHVWQDRLIEMEESRQELRRKRREIHRERFQDSTSRIHRPTDSSSVKADALREELEQLQLEMVLLREDHRLERKMWEDDHRNVVDAPPSPMPSMADVEETEVVVLDAEMESDDAPSHPEIDDALIDAVVGTAQVQGPRPIPEAESETDVPIEQEPEPRLELEFEPDIESAGAPKNEPDVEPVGQSTVQFEAESTGTSPSQARQDTTVAPVPSDIEQLFGGGVSTSKSVIKDTPDAEEDAKQATLPREHNVEKVRDEEPAEEAASFDESLLVVGESTEILENPTPIAPAATDLDIPHIPDIPDIPDIEEAPSFSIHWQSDRPRRRKASPEKPQETLLSGKPESRRDIPVFRSLHDMLSASGVAYADDTYPEDSYSGEQGSVAPPTAPYSTPASEADEPAEDDQLIRRIVNLDADSFSLLSELGYANLRRLAGLSPSEIRRLAAVFRIKPERIEQNWKPTATAHLNMLSASGS